jgi:NAD(P)-dependent dehydrogenase (short-subunit alcohol dehydrogenase family)
MVNHAVTRFGRLDCLVNNAGRGSPMVSITEVTAEHFASVFDTNVRGAMFGMKHAAPIMIAQGSGSIITIASAAGLRGAFSGHIYSASKAAVIHLSRCVASEISSRGVRVNTISPGGILTGIFAKEAGLDGAKADRALRLVSYPIYSPPYSQFDAPALPTTSPMPQCFSPAMRRRSSPDMTLLLMAVWLPLRSPAGRRSLSSARKSLGVSVKQSARRDCQFLIHSRATVQS